MMRHTGITLPYTEGEGWQAVELPYTGGRLAMRIILSTDPAVAPASALTPDILTEIDANPTDTIVNVTMPRFDYQSDLELVGLLQQMGMTAPFGDADFSGISEEPLFIGEAVHRADITVDEWGTEAATVTGVAMAVSGPPTPEAALIADRPFAFVIVETTTGLPLFMGQVADPAE